MTQRLNMAPWITEILNGRKPDNSEVALLIAWLLEVQELEDDFALRALQDRLVKTLGTIPPKPDSRFWIEVKDVEMTEAEMKQQFGELCLNYDEDCPCCKGWREWRVNKGKVTLLIDRPTLLYQQLTGE